MTFFQNIALIINSILDMYKFCFVIKFRLSR